MRPSSLRADKRERSAPAAQSPITCLERRQSPRALGQRQAFFALRRPPSVHFRFEEAQNARWVIALTLTAPISRTCYALQVPFMLTMEAVE